MHLESIILRMIEKSMRQQLLYLKDNIDQWINRKVLQISSRAEEHHLRSLCMILENQIMKKNKDNHHREWVDNNIWNHSMLEIIKILNLKSQVECQWGKLEAQNTQFLSHHLMNHLKISKNGKIYRIKLKQSIKESFSKSMMKLSERWRILNKREKN